MEKQKRQADLAKIEPTIKKTFYKISINEYQDMNTGLYDFYIDPYVWMNMPYDGKEGAFKLAVLYAKLKTNEIHTNDDYLFATKIRSSYDKSVLAKYSAFGGIELY
jgi:hypothetical protein